MISRKDCGREARSRWRACEREGALFRRWIDGVVVSGGLLKTGGEPTRAFAGGCFMMRRN